MNPLSARAMTAMLALLVAALAIISLLTGPAHIAPARALAALVSDQGVATIVVRDIRLPRMLLSVSIGATFGLAGASLQGLLRNPLAEPSLFGAPQAAAAAAAAIMAFGFANALSIAVPLGGIAGALLSVGALVAIAGRRASLTVTLLAGLALASLAGAAIALILNLAPNPFVALEIAFWLLGSLQDRSMAHVWLAAPFMIASWVVLAFNARAFRVLTLGEDAAASLGVNVERTRTLVVIGVALGVGAAGLDRRCDLVRRSGRAASGSPVLWIGSRARDVSCRFGRRRVADRGRYRGEARTGRD